MLTHICRWVATLGPIGFTSAPGTSATAVTIILLYFLQSVLAIHLSIPVLMIVLIVSWFIIECALQCSNYKKNDDPAEIVLDEVIGTMITFMSITLTAQSVIIGFLLFRFFDIIKPLGIARLEKITGATGIMIDDIVAGLISTLLLRVMLMYAQG